MKTRKILNPAAFFVRSSQICLLQHCLATWPRRGHSLLDINCGDGRFLPMLWDCGFDVTATENSVALRNKVLKKLGNKVEINLAHADCLPYEDNAFEWVILHLSAEDTEGIEASLSEALRLAERGLAITFWNSFSLPALLNKIFLPKEQWIAPQYHWWKIRQQVRTLSSGRISSHSLFFFSMRPLCGRCLQMFCPTAVSKLPFGAWSVIRVDLGAARLVTPLALRFAQRNLRSFEPAMEYQSEKTLKK